MKKKNNLDKKEVDELFKSMKKKGISGIKMAKQLGYAHSAIYNFFNLYQSCEVKYEKIKKYINNYSEHIKIPQMFYGRLEIDTREKDVIIIAMVEKTETNLIQIERYNISKLIKVLKSELKNVSK
jgi:hypothetical protein